MRVRNVVLALLGAAVLVLKPAYLGPCEEAVQSYAGNVAVSFALYFAAINATARFRRPRVVAALAALVAVEAFEISDGFGVMTNVVDPVDLAANIVGIALAVAVDVLTARGLRRSTRAATRAPRYRRCHPGHADADGGPLDLRGGAAVPARHADTRPAGRRRDRRLARGRPHGESS